MGEKRRHSQTLDIEQQNNKRAKQGPDVTSRHLHPQGKHASLNGPQLLPLVATTNSPIPVLPPINDAVLYRTVFTHSSVVPAKYNERSTDCYERLEWLGDAYLEVIASQVLYTRFPQHLPGKLSKLRQDLVCNETLAGYSKIYGFHKLLNAPASVLEGRNATKILGDVFEAYIAALVMDQPKCGLTTATEWMATLWEPLMAKEKPPPEVGKLDAKTLLASRICIRDTKLKYKETKPMTFNSKKGSTIAYIGVFLTGWGYTEKLIGYGEAPGKIEAGMLAAANAMEENKVLIEALEEKKRIHETERKRLLEENTSMN